jgi:hypothetical protein
MKSVNSSKRMVIILKKMIMDIHQNQMILMMKVEVDLLKKELMIRDTSLLDK